MLAHYIAAIIPAGYGKHQIARALNDLITQKHTKRWEINPIPDSNYSIRVLAENRGCIFKSKLNKEIMSRSIKKTSMSL